MRKSNFFKRLINKKGSNQAATLAKEKKDTALRIKPNETLQQRLGYLYEVEGILQYKQGDFEEAEVNLLRAMQNYYYTYEGIECLAIIYRKRKDTLSEVATLKKGIEMLTKENDPSQDVLIMELKNQLERARKRILRDK
ncbi:hypothetical protein [Jeotgalibaca dankookensis]|uniref:hypothetical protein n=2 Tax=Jeotgalibaca dankookensis TaxID=708126 RepID=UPI00078068CF|nr:hypothetical protein [Jeotgalibaca dankookensis]